MERLALAVSRSFVGAIRILFFQFSPTKPLSYLISEKLVDSKKEAYLGPDDLSILNGNLPFDTAPMDPHRAIPRNHCKFITVQFFFQE